MKIFSKKFADVSYNPSPTGVKGRLSDHIFTNQETNEKIMFAKLEMGTSYAKMKVFGPTHYFVLKGELIIDNQGYEEGTYIRIESDQEYTPSTIKGCDVLCIYTGGYFR